LIYRGFSGKSHITLLGHYNGCLRSYYAAMNYTDSFDVIVVGVAMLVQRQHWLRLEQVLPPFY